MIASVGITTGVLLSILWWYFLSCLTVSVWNKFKAVTIVK